MLPSFNVSPLKTESDLHLMATPIETASRVALISAPSSNSEITVTVLAAAAHDPLVGQMVFVVLPTTSNGEPSGEELALGVVTSVDVTNRAHMDSKLRLVLSQMDDPHPLLSGDKSDTRTANIKLQACYRKPRGGNAWQQSGSSLSTAPSTGTLIQLINNTVVEEIITPPVGDGGPGNDLHYVGNLHGAAVRGTQIRAPFNMRDFQGGRGAYHTAIFGMSGAGKALDVETPILTTAGWKTMGEIVTGDEVFDENGAVSEVLKAHNVLHGRTCYNVGFSDGSMIVADAEHLWYTTPGPRGEGVVVTTEQIKNTLTINHNDLKEVVSNHGVPVAKPLETFPLANGNLTGGDFAGYETRNSREQLLHKLTSQLTSVPADRGGVCYTNTNPGTAKMVHELAAASGRAATITPTPQGDVVTIYPPTMTMRYITTVTLVESRPVKCLTVSSPNKLYLAGRNLIPTHNTALASLMFASMFRHEKMGMVIVDPQGQFANEPADVPFSLQGFATEMGRTVNVHRISEDLRLEKDAPLFTQLLGKTKFLSQIAKMGPEIHELVSDEMERILKDTPNWETMQSEALFVKMFTTLIDSYIDTAGMIQYTYLKRVYSDPTRRTNLAEAVTEMLKSPQRTADAMVYFRPLHNLFQNTNPAGGARHSMWGTLAAVFDKASRDKHDDPAPLLILDMSTTSVSWLQKLTSNEERAAAEETIALLDDDTIKAAILRQIFSTMKRASETKYRESENLNTMIVLDEAWRYAPPLSATSDKEIMELSRDLAGYSRDTRKFGIGWTFITQTPRHLNLDILGQALCLIAGYGLTGADLAKISEQVDDSDHLQLYKGFAPPDATTPPVYPFMFLGPVSPLSFTRAPVFVAAYTNFDDFRKDNNTWITKIRQKLGKPTLKGLPEKPRETAGSKAARTLASTTAARNHRTARDAAVVKANAATGGVDMNLYNHLPEPDDNWGNPLDLVNGADTPF